MFDDLEPHQIEEIAKSFQNAGNLALGGFVFAPGFVLGIKNGAWFYILGVLVWGWFHWMATQLFQWASRRKRERKA